MFFLQTQGAENLSDDTLIDLRVERPSLEDRFLEITGDAALCANIGETPSGSE